MHGEDADLEVCEGVTSKIMGTGVFPFLPTKSRKQDLVRALGKAWLVNTSLETTPIYNISHSEGALEEGEIITSGRVPDADN